MLCDTFVPIYIVCAKWMQYLILWYFISERVKQTEATGDRFEEAKNINKSLMTLGSVIKGML